MAPLVQMWTHLVPDLGLNNVSKQDLRKNIHHQALREGVLYRDVNRTKNPAEGRLSCPIAWYSWCIDCIHLLRIS